MLFGIFLLYSLTRRRNIGRQGHRLPDNSLSSEKGRDLLGSSATPQSPSSSSLLSDAFHLTEKRNGTATTNTTTTLLSNQGNGGHHGNSYTGIVIHSNPSNGHGNAVYASSNCKTSSEGMMYATEILAADMLDGRTGTRERGRPEGGERESGEGNEEDEGLGEGLADGMKGLEEELASFPMFKSPAPLAMCEESSIWTDEAGCLLGGMQNGFRMTTAKCLWMGAVEWRQRHRENYVTYKRDLCDRDMSICWYESLRLESVQETLEGNMTWSDSPC